MVRIKSFDKLGEGGMGEVYRAHDSKLARDVALKFLPLAFTSDPDRLARFEREAHVLAALNHPHIGAIYGLEEADGMRTLVLELVEGETLAERLATGPIPPTTAFEMARQIAEALEAAHDKGIVHRDLKPANIKITPRGLIKVLDFGLAKAIDTAGQSGVSSPAQLSSERSALTSPTLTSPALMTGVGVLLGTAAYMSPEQARGQIVDKRADVWAFGCVLYEMLTGRRAFLGDTTSDVLARVIEREPDWSALPSSLPEPIHRLLTRSLRKDPRRRLSDMADARIEIDDALTTPVDRDRAGVVSGKTARRMAWLAAIALFIFGLAAAAAFLSAPASRVLPIRLSAIVPPGTKFQVGGGALGAPAGNSGSISPDGRKLIFTLEDASGKWQMWMRPIDGVNAQPLPGTETANSPFWSPDSRYIGFFTGDGKLKKFDSTNGVVTTICNAPAGRGGDWNGDNIIVFAPSNTAGLYRVPAAGGEPAPATRLGTGHAWHRSPSFLPDGRHFLYRVNGAESGIFLGSFDSLEGVKLLDADTNAIYAAPGYVLFARQATLFAQPFDLDALRPVGEAVPIAEDVSSDLANGLSAFSVSTAVRVSLPVRHPPRAISSVYRLSRRPAVPRLASHGRRDRNRR